MGVAEDGALVERPIISATTVLTPTATPTTARRISKR